jgi:hypothetical protein
MINSLLRTLQEEKGKFDELWIDVEKICDQMDIEIRIPNAALRSMKRHNAEESAKDFFNRTIFVPGINVVHDDLSVRFAKNNGEDILSLYSLFPAYSNNEETRLVEILKKLTQKSTHEVSGEVRLWRQFSKEISAQTSMELFTKCDEDAFPLINMGISALVIIGVSNATCERSFSSLRRLKSWLRTTMSQNRLTGLALMSIHRDINISFDTVINRFSQCARRLKLLM